MAPFYWPKVGRPAFPLTRPCSGAASGGAGAGATASPRAASRAARRSAAPRPPPATASRTARPPASSRTGTGRSVVDEDFTRSARLGRKMKTSPANGSARSACCTSAASPSMPFLKSTGSAASRIRTPGGTAITPGPAPPRAPGAAPPRPRPRRPAPPPGRARSRSGPPARRCRRRILRDHHRHEPGSLAHRRGREPLAPDEQLARVQPVAPRHRRDRRRRVEALGHDPGLLLVGPAAPPADAGDHLEPAEAVVVRTGRSTMSTHRSRA